MRTLAIDIETFSSTDLTKSGVHKYVEALDFEILLLSYAIDGGEPMCVDLLAGDTLPVDILDALTSPAVLKTAHNAVFERTCMAKYFGLPMPPEQWECTMVKVAMLGLPLSLDAAAKALKLDAEKDAAGKALIRYFSLPCKPTKTNGGRTRNLPEHDPERWEKYKSYNLQDVRVELAIRGKLSAFQIPDQERRLWQLDQYINDNGILVDTLLVRNAIRQDLAYKETLTEEAVRITGLDNPNSATQLKDWLGKEMDSEVETLRKDDIPALLQATDKEAVQRVLQIRQEMAKTSVKKYKAIAACVCADRRVRGLLQFGGANRTGRWAGRLVQVHNLPRNEMSDLELAREMVRQDNLGGLELLFGNVPDALSQLIRTAFIAPKGHKLLVADFSAIEARVIAWLAGEKWRLGVFATHGKIYEASAAQMFGVPLESVTKGSDLRQKGKVSELALGYQGGPNALIKMGALKMGIVEEELPRLVAMWRQANKAIVRYWDCVGNAAIEAVEFGQPVTISHGIVLRMERNILFIQLPSGRRLAYVHPQLRPGKYGGTVLAYEGMDQTTKKWGMQETYGGKLVENIVQAVARDCLAVAMLRLSDAGYRIVMHVHDEVVLEVPDTASSTEKVNEIMGMPIDWAPGLPLKAESFETSFYKKD
ncbi:DNA polymerase [Chitinophaga rhizosphaerae]|uniref:DNA polymerase n=1 Tax=Chitinophaga rhizosphaerae TaxID=1864947 RepID=UPI000F814DFB|nr:DNA polymerase [Chitinophaga rhizosphaerae]